MLTEYAASPSFACVHVEWWLAVRSRAQNAELSSRLENRGTSNDARRSPLRHLSRGLVAKPGFHPTTRARPPRQSRAGRDKAARFEATRAPAHESDHATLRKEKRLTDVIFLRSDDSTGNGMFCRANGWARFRERWSAGRIVSEAARWKRCPVKYFVPGAKDR